jgi:hypothetical protein
MSRTATPRGSAMGKHYRRSRDATDKINSLAGEDDASDLDITNVVERELQTDKYISG